MMLTGAVWMILFLINLPISLYMNKYVYNDVYIYIENTVLHSVTKICLLFILLASHHMA